MEFLDRFTALDQATGLSIVIKADGSNAISICEISRKGNEIHIRKAKAGYVELNDAAKAIDYKSVVSLNISGKGILHREIAGTAAINQNNFHSFLPNASFDDFYVQQFVSGDKSFISVVRRSEADRWLQQLSSIGITVLEISLGPFTASGILNQLNVYDNDICFDEHQITRNDAGDWLSYRRTAGQFSAFPLKVGTTAIKEQVMLAYAQAFQLLLKPAIDPVEAGVAQLKKSHSQLLEDRRLKAYGFAGLIIVFAALLINYLVLSHLNSENVRMAGNLSLTSQNANELHDINQIAARDEQLLIALGWEENIDKSKLIDQLASLLPATITWKEISVDPQDIQQSQLKKQTVFSVRKIFIKGESKELLPVNEWMARCKTLKWINGVTLKNFTYNNEESIGEFSMEIMY